jgi:hypothetical protein
VSNGASNERPAGPSPAFLFVRGAIELGAKVIGGIDPHTAADQVDRTIAARNGNARDFWSAVLRLSSERLDRLDIAGCTCGPALREEPMRCLACGGLVPRTEVLGRVVE